MPNFGDDNIRYALYYAQVEQDNGHTWGEALKRAERYVSFQP